MQGFPQIGFVKRSVYYLTRTFGRFLLKGENYKNIRPAYSLIFAGFVMFKDSEDSIHSFSLRSDKPPHFRLSDDLSITVVELGKFLDKNLKNLVDRKALWCYFLKESGTMSMKEAQILSEKGEDMKQATSHLIHLSKDQKLSLYKEGLWRQKADRRARDDYVRKEGMQQGMQKGMQKVVLNMLKKNIETSLISEVTGLSPEEIKKLQNGN